MTEHLDNCTCSEVGTADTDNNKNFRIALDLLCCLLDPCKLVLIIVDGKIDPSKEIISCSLLGNKKLLRVFRDLFHVLNFMIRDKRCCFWKSTWIPVAIISLEPFTYNACRIQTFIKSLSHHKIKAFFALFISVAIHGFSEASHMYLSAL